MGWTGRAPAPDGSRVRYRIITLNRPARLTAFTRRIVYGLMVVKDGAAPRSVIYHHSR
jgi:predicted DNA-binding transcriptional regulator AlpA